VLKKVISNVRSLLDRREHARQQAKRIPSEVPVGKIKSIHFRVVPIHIPRDGVMLPGSALGKSREFRVLPNDKSGINARDLSKWNIDCWDVCRLLDKRRTRENIVRTYVQGLYDEFKEGLYEYDVRVTADRSGVHIIVYFGPMRSVGEQRPVQVM
jgi:hypothetical protein